MATLKDIAAEVGLAASTVGRALADHPHVHDETKARVRAVASRMGYVGHAPARVMRGGRSDLIGLVIPNVRNEFYSTAAQAISEVCAHEGFQVVLSLTDDSAERERDHLRSLLAARCAGVIVVPTARIGRETAALLADVPCVQFIRRTRALHAPWFGIDDAAATRLAVEHLVGLGHSAIGYVGGALELSTGDARFRGFCEALAVAGISPRAEWCVHGPGDDDAGARATHRILADASPPSALVLAGSRLTVGALDAVRELGIKVPQALSIVGFNERGALGWWGSGVTSVALPVSDIAHACASGLLSRLRRPASSGEADPPAVAMFSPCLIERGSTAPSGVANRPR